MLVEAAPSLLNFMAAVTSQVTPAEATLTSMLTAFLALAALEIILGIDNVVFISILVGKLPKKDRKKAMNIGLTVAMGSRIVLLFFISWIMAMSKPLFSLFGQEFSVKSMIVIGGGLFLLFKSVREIHHKIEGDADHHATKGKTRATMASIMLQIFIIDLVFSIDSVITAVGMTKVIAIMIGAVITSVAVMMLFANSIARFVEKHPTVKVLALCFLILIGVLLVAEGMNQHIDRNYIYFAMGFALVVELINMKVRARKTMMKKMVDKTVEA